MTPFNRLRSEDILSSHINGLTSAVNNIEQTLGMRTVTISGHALSPVNDMNDITLRNRIYEGTIRNWTTFTVRRNGAVVAPDEYAAHGGFGAVVFHVAQNPAAAITVDATRVTNRSTVIEELSEDTENSLSTTVLQPRNAWISGLINLTDPHSIATNITQAAQTIDAFPIYLKKDTILDRMRSTTTAAVTQPTTTMVMGIYRDNGNAFPSTLLAQTASFNATSAGVNDYALQAGTVTLSAGLYWLARYQSAGVTLDGFRAIGIMQIFDPTTAAHINGTTPMAFCQGVRSGTMGNITTLPSTFPALGTGANTSSYLKRDFVGGVWVRKI